jgi:RNA polymerase sigma-70 factor, ECF subfamily
MGIPLGKDNQTQQFEELALPYLAAAYNLARWLTRKDQDAEDLVQTAFMRAFLFSHDFRGGNARAGLMTVVRPANYTSLHDRRHEANDVSVDRETHGQNKDGIEVLGNNIGSNPESILPSYAATGTLNQALQQLPPDFREIAVLKDIEVLSFKDMAQILGIPIGTVMSRVARARKLLYECVKQNTDGK